jgi:hypothetical protein
MGIVSPDNPDNPPDNPPAKGRKWVLCPQITQITQ